MKRSMVRTFLAMLAAAALVAGCAAPAQQAKSPVEAAAAAKVSAVSGSDLPDRVRVKIEGNAPLAFTVFRLSEPLRIVVDLADADVKDLAKEIPVSLGNVGTIRPVQFEEQAGRIGRLEIGLTESWEYATSREGNAIFVDFLKPNGVKAGETPASAERIPVLTGSAGDDTPVVTATYVVTDCGVYKFGFAVYDSLGNPHVGTPDEESEEIHVAADPPAGLKPSDYNSFTDTLILAIL